MALKADPEGQEALGMRRSMSGQVLWEENPELGSGLVAEPQGEGVSWAGWMRAGNAKGDVQMSPSCEQDTPMTSRPAEDTITAGSRMLGPGGGESKGGGERGTSRGCLPGSATRELCDLRKVT